MAREDISYDAVEQVPSVMVNISETVSATPNPIYEGCSEEGQTRSNGISYSEDFCQRCQDTGLTPLPMAPDASNHKIQIITRCAYC